MEDTNLHDRVVTVKELSSVSSPRRFDVTESGGMTTTNPAPEASPPSVSSEYQTFTIKSA